MTQEFFSLQWLIGDRLQRVTFQEDSRGWLLSFISGSSLLVECMWRLKVNGNIFGTSEDHGHKFGLPAPFDAAAALIEHTSNQGVSSVQVGSGTTDLSISFGKDILLEVLQTSAGYESWHAMRAAGGNVHALGSGELCA